MNPKIRVANAPCSWGVLEFEGMSEPGDCDQVLDEIAASGFQGTELGDWGFMPTDPGALRAAVESRNLSLIAAFVPVPFARPTEAVTGIDTAVRTARLLAEAGTAPFIVLSDDNGSDPVRTGKAGRIGPEHSLDADGWNTAASIANEVAQAVFDSTGLRTVLHHHAAGFVETPTETLEMLQRTNPERLGLCLDTGHWTFGGGDPVAAIQAHGDRIWHVHFKDCAAAVADTVADQDEDYFAAVRRGVFCELGQGSVDFPAVLEALQARDYDGWIVVEQDVLPGMGSPLESAIRNRDYLAQLGL